MSNSSPSAASIQRTNHPFPFLLYLEWGLLGIALLGELVPSRFLGIAARFPLLMIGSILGFGLLGLRLPTRSLGQKIGYTVLEIALIVVATAMGSHGIRLFPLLYVVLVIRSCLIFRRMGQLWITGAAFWLFLLVLIYRVRSVDMRLPPIAMELPRRAIAGFALNFALLFGLALLFVLFMVNALLTERQSREKLAAANAQLRHYALRIENLAMVQERNRIAREIHDSLGHSLTALNLQLEGALRLWRTDPNRADAFLQEAKRLGSTALQDVRQSVAAMRSDPVQGRSLPEAIHALVEGFHRSTGVQPMCQVQLAMPLSDESKTVLYRLVQEALTNIAKHAAATQVTIDLHTTATALHLTIQDNGNGFQAGQTQTGFGLQGMRERTAILGGNLKITSAPHQGCCITARFPLATLEMKP